MIDNVENNKIISIETWILSIYFNGIHNLRDRTLQFIKELCSIFCVDLPEITFEVNWFSINPNFPGNNSTNIPYTIICETTGIQILPDDCIHNKYSEIENWLLHIEYLDFVETLFCFQRYFHFIFCNVNDYRRKYLYWTD